MPWDLAKMVHTSTPPTETTPLSVEFRIWEDKMTKVPISSPNLSNKAQKTSIKKNQAIFYFSCFYLIDQTLQVFPDMRLEIMTEHQVQWVSKFQELLLAEGWWTHSSAPIKCTAGSLQRHFGRWMLKGTDRQNLVVQRLHVLACVSESTLKPHSRNRWSC